jgi:hypothetical protein
MSSHSHENTDDDPLVTLRKLYPHLSEVDLVIAKENIDRYLALVLRIFERVEAERDRAQNGHASLADEMSE